MLYKYIVIIFVRLYHITLTIGVRITNLRLNIIISSDITTIT